jgi:hypothetical protein
MRNDLSNVFNEFNEKLNGFEKAKANTGDIRNWGGVDYKKISNGEWIKVGGNKQKSIASSGMKKVISSEINKIDSELSSIISDFKQKWEKENGSTQIIKYRVAFSREIEINPEIKYIRDKYYSNRKDLLDDINEVNNLADYKAKLSREEKSGKKEIQYNDLDDNFESFSQAFREVDKLPSYVGAIECLGEKVNADDYWLNTDALFKTFYEYSENDCYSDSKDVWVDPVEVRWKNLKSNADLEHTFSPKSSSEYLVDKKNNKVYRMADHWGRCASCNWGVDFKNKNYGIGESNFDDFERNNGGTWINNKKSEMSLIINKKVLFDLKKIVSNNKTYLDKQATDRIKNMTKKIESSLKNQSRLNDEEINKIKKQYKELFKMINIEKSTHIDFYKSINTSNSFQDNFDLLMKGLDKSKNRLVTITDVKGNVRKVWKHVESGDEKTAGVNAGKNYEKTGKRHTSHGGFISGDSVTFIVGGEEVKGIFRHVNESKHSTVAVIRGEDNKLYERSLSKIQKFNNQNNGDIKWITPSKQREEGLKKISKIAANIVNKLRVEKEESKATTLDKKIITSIKRTSKAIVDTQKKLKNRKLTEKQRESLENNMRIFESKLNSMTEDVLKEDLHKIDDENFKNLNTADDFGKDEEIKESLHIETRKTAKNSLVGKGDTASVGFNSKSDKTSWQRNDSISFNKNGITKTGRVMKVDDNFTHVRLSSGMVEMVSNKNIKN